MRRTLLIFAAIAAIVVVEFAWLAPATLVDRRLEQATAGALRLADTEGTIWHARGMLIGGGARLPLAWDLDFWPILRGEWRIDITPYAGTRSGPPRAKLDLRAGSLSMGDVEIVVPASMVAALAALPAGWAVGGEVRATATAFEWAPPASRGDLAIEWQHARLQLAPGGSAIDLGTVVGAMKAQGNAVGGPIRNDGGTLSVQGEWASRMGEGMLVTLTLAPRPGSDPALADALAALGPPVDGGWRVEWRVAGR